MSTTPSTLPSPNGVCLGCNAPEFNGICASGFAKDALKPGDVIYVEEVNNGPHSLDNIPAGYGIIFRTPESDISNRYMYFFGPYGGDNWSSTRCTLKEVTDKTAQEVANTFQDWFWGSGDNDFDRMMTEFRLEHGLLKM